MNTKTFLARFTCTGLFAALVAAAPPLKAQDFRFGAGLSVVNPYGDLSDTAKLGFGVSAFGELGFTQSQALRGRVEYALFGEKDLTHLGTDSLGIKYTGSANALLLFADYILRLESHNKGLYAFGGVGIVNGTFKVEGSLSGISASESESKSKLGYSAGAGYNFNRNLGLEASLTATDGGDEFIDFNYVRVSFKYRF